jgi:hypothetical protein
MHTSSGDQSPLGPQLCSEPIRLQPSHDDGMTAFRGILIAGTASIVLWGICIVVVMMLRSRS